MTSIICIGDPHFQLSNIEQVELFLERITKLVIEKKPKIVVILGDLLHTHEIINTL